MSGTADGHLAYLTAKEVGSFTYPGGYPRWLVVAQDAPIAAASPHNGRVPVWRLDAL